MAVISSSDEDFRSIILGNEFVVVNFFADWAGTCKLVAPKFLELSEQEKYNCVLFLEIDVDANPQTKVFAGVDSVPSVALFKDGQLVEIKTIGKAAELERFVSKIDYCQQVF